MRWKRAPKRGGIPSTAAVCQCTKRIASWRAGTRLRLGGGRAPCGNPAKSRAACSGVLETSTIFISPGQVLTGHFRMSTVWTRARSHDQGWRDGSDVAGRVSVSCSKSGIGVLGCGGAARPGTVSCRTALPPLKAPPVRVSHKAILAKGWPGHVAAQLLEPAAVRAELRVHGFPDRRGALGPDGPVDRARPAACRARLKRGKHANRFLNYRPSTRSTPLSKVATWAGERRPMRSASSERPIV